MTDEGTPSGADARPAWDEVGVHFSALGRLVKERFKQADAPGQDELKSALRAVADSVDQALTTLGEAVRDQAVREEAKQATKSFGDALAATFDEVADDVKRIFTKEK